MTECNTGLIEFARLKGKKVVADFTGGRMTSDAGLLMLQEVERKLQLFDRVDAVVRDPRNPNAITHSQRTLIAQRIAAIAAGYEDLNDHQALRNDPVIQLLTGNLPDETTPLASPSTRRTIRSMVNRKADSFTATTTSTVTCLCTFFQVNRCYVPIFDRRTSMREARLGDSCLVDAAASPSLAGGEDRFSR